MANILDYLSWRGNLTFRQDPFNEVDNLILSELCFFDFCEVMEESDILNLGSAASHFFEKYPKESHRLGLLFSPSFEELLDRASHCRRFENTLVSHPVSILKEEPAMQFSATTFTLEDDSVFVAFRGTDDHIVGWKESFSLGIQDEIPGQSTALAYLREVLAHTSAPVRVGGHSKGGNLALYAALHLSDKERERIIGIYCNDSPGFRRDLADTDAYKSIADRCLRITPYLSIVGAMLEHGNVNEIVASDGKGLFQHDAFNWHVQGNRFVRLPDRSKESRQFEYTLRYFLAELNDDEKREFLETYYKLITASGATTLSELKEDGLRAAQKMAASLLTLSKDVRQLILRATGILFRQIRAVKNEEKQRLRAPAVEVDLTEKEFAEHLDEELTTILDEPKKKKTKK